MWVVLDPTGKVFIYGPKESGHNPLVTQEYVLHLSRHLSLLHVHLLQVRVADGVVRWGVVQLVCKFSITFPFPTFMRVCM